jgi:hypothetical protein
MGKGRIRIHTSDWWIRIQGGPKTCGSGSPTLLILVPYPGLGVSLHGGNLVLFFLYLATVIQKWQH